MRPGLSPHAHLSAATKTPEDQGAGPHQGRRPPAKDCRRAAVFGCTPTRKLRANLPATSRRCQLSGAREGARTQKAQKPSRATQRALDVKRARTKRRTPSAAPSDQVYIISTKPRQSRLEGDSKLRKSCRFAVRCGRRARARTRHALPERTANLPVRSGAAKN